MAISLNHALSEQELNFIQQQTFIAVRAYFPDSEIVRKEVILFGDGSKLEYADSPSDTIICYKDGEQVAIVEIDLDTHSTNVYFSIIGFKIKNVYGLTYDGLLRQLRETARNAFPHSEE